jgi:hypothetical protein
MLSGQTSNGARHGERLYTSIVERGGTCDYFWVVPKEEPIITEGTVTEVLPGTMFRVELPAQCPRAYFRQNAETFHSYRAGRQSFSRAFAL